MKTDDNTYKHIKVGFALGVLFTLLIILFKLIQDKYNILISIGLVFIIAFCKEYIWDWRIKPYLSTHPEHWLNQSWFGKKFLHYEQPYPPKKDWGDIMFTTVAGIVGSVSCLILFRILQELIILIKQL